MIAGALVKLDPTVDEGAKVAGNLLQRLLGPSADAIGEDWAAAIKRRNLRRLLKKVDARATSKNPGLVPPRLVSQVFEAAQYADEEIMSEYFSGILASSRGGQGGNDGGVPWSALVSRLSSDQVRLHYVLYSSLRSTAMKAGLKGANELHDALVLLPLIDVIDGCDFADPDGQNRFSDAVDGLMREGLIMEEYSYGSIEHLEDKYPYITDKTLAAPFEAGIRFGMSIHGIRLFLWGLGVASNGSDAYLDASINVEAIDMELMPAVVAGGGFYDDFLIAAD